jgi:hypothetical protein
VRVDLTVLEPVIAGRFPISRAESRTFDFDPPL